MKIFSLLFIFYVLQINVLFANQNIAFIDMNRIINETKAGSSILKQLNDVNNKILKKLNAEEENLKKKEIKLISQKNILSQSDFELNFKKLKTEINEYNQKKNKIINNFSKKKTINTNKFFLEINKIIAEYSDIKDISIILQKKYLVLGKSELDLSDEIIVIIDKNIKEFKIK
jgi:Skp family chaperone for outer membrane proteins